jgi:exodeoxyribonuclease-1
MTRALRPDGIKWPFTDDGKPVNRLELLTAANKIEHIGAHDALADVKATISVAKLIKDKQPKLFSYLLSIRNKKQVAPIVESNEPFIYTSGRISSEYLNTSPFVNLAKNSDAGSAVVYDLRFDPEELIDLSVDELIDKWKYVPNQPSPDKPFKTIKYNHAPAISPMGVLDDASLKRLSINLEEVKKNLAKLNKIKPEFSKKISEVINAMDNNREKEIKAKQSDAPYNPDNMLYDGFFGDGDNHLFEQIHNAKPDQINEAGKDLKDRRLVEMLPLYKARNYPKSLSAEEMETWEYYCSEKLTGGNESSPLAYYFAKLDELSQKKMTKDQSFLIEELKLYGQSLLP